MGLEVILVKSGRLECKYVRLGGVRILFKSAIQNESWLSHRYQSKQKPTEILYTSAGAFNKVPQCQIKTMKQTKIANKNVHFRCPKTTIILHFTEKIIK